ncbi:hypothetical protein FRB90_007625 [Tulasnella sp. 427]|nr:hypothetical protein FRB90_007625 [Tulasnella sp. 427]
MSPLKLAEWLRRSKAVPLVIGFSEEVPEAPQVPGAATDSLFEHIRHWGRIICDSGRYWGLESFLEQLDGSEAPLLEKLILYQDTLDLDIDAQSPFPLRKIFNGLGSVPKLVEVELWMVDRKPSLEQFVTVLERCPQLRRLAVLEGVVRPEDLKAAFATPSARTPVHLHSLASLTVSAFGDGQILAHTFRLIDAPNLDTLHLIDLNAGDYSSAIRALGEGALSSFQRLKTLDVRRVSCRSQGAWSLFCTKLIKLRLLALAALEGGSRQPGQSGDPYEGYLSALLESGSTAETRSTGDVNELLEAGANVNCLGLETLLVSEECNRNVVLNFARRRSALGFGIRLVRIGKASHPPDELKEELSGLGTEWEGRYGRYVEASDFECDFSVGQELEED